MALHDWTRVPAGLFHDFHQSWSIRIKDALNSGLLPPGLSALVEQRAGAYEGDVLAIEQVAPAGRTGASTSTLERPQARIIQRSPSSGYAARANRIVVRHHLGRIVAVLEIVSPGNKESRGAVRDFVHKAVDLIRSGIHLMAVDLFPPSPRDPQGIHAAIWEEFGDDAFEFPAGKDRLVVSYQAGREKVAYVEPLAVGDALPEMPLFVSREYHVLVPLEATYTATWSACPEAVRSAVLTGILPEPDAEA
jgi:hypothetical protein